MVVKWTVFTLLVINVAVSNNAVQSVAPSSSANDPLGALMLNSEDIVISGAKAIFKLFDVSRSPQMIYKMMKLYPPMESAYSSYAELVEKSVQIGVEVLQRSETILERIVPNEKVNHNQNDAATTKGYMCVFKANTIASNRQVEGQLTSYSLMMDFGMRAMGYMFAMSQCPAPDCVEDVITGAVQNEMAHSASVESKMIELMKTEEHIWKMMDDCEQNFHKEVGAGSLEDRPVVKRFIREVSNSSSYDNHTLLTYSTAKPPINTTQSQQLHTTPTTMNSLPSLTTPSPNNATQSELSTTPKPVSTNQSQLSTTLPPKNPVQSSTTPSWQSKSTKSYSNTNQTPHTSARPYITTSQTSSSPSEESGESSPPRKHPSPPPKKRRPHHRRGGPARQRIDQKEPKSNGDWPINSHNPHRRMKQPPHSRGRKWKDSDENFE